METLTTPRVEFSESLGSWVLTHVCDRTSTNRGVYTVSIRLHPDHVVSEDGKTVKPSLLCSDCGTHGFWADGTWRDV